jgi:hypothetical protein
MKLAGLFKITMETIKNYTDINQSRKLTEIISPTTADAFYRHVSWNNNTCVVIQRENIIFPDVYDIPCWSLAALLATLPNEIITDSRFECHYQIHIRKYDGGDNTTLYQIAYGNDRGSSGSWHDMINTGEKESLIDCCVQMIERLHELKML